MGVASTKIHTGTLGAVSTTNRFPVDAAVTGDTTSGYVSTISFARTADTNAYAALDVIGINAAGSPGSAIHTLASAGPSGGKIVILGWDLKIDLTAIPSGMTSFNLDLYSASPTAILDNAAFDLVTADQLTHLVRLDPVLVSDLGSTLYGRVNNQNDEVALATSSTSLFAILSTNGAYTPASGTTYRIRLRTVAV